MCSKCEKNNEVRPHYSDIENENDNMDLIDETLKNTVDNVNMI